MYFYLFILLLLSLFAAKQRYECTFAWTMSTYVAVRYFPKEAERGDA